MYNKSPNLKYRRILFEFHLKSSEVQMNLWILIRFFFELIQKFEIFRIHKMN